MLPVWFYPHFATIFKQENTEREFQVSSTAIWIFRSVCPTREKDRSPRSYRLISTSATCTFRLRCRLTSNRIKCAVRDLCIFMYTRTVLTYARRHSEQSRHNGWNPTKIPWLTIDRKIHYCRKIRQKREARKTRLFHKGSERTGLHRVISRWIIARFQFSELHENPRERIIRRNFTSNFIGLRASKNTIAPRELN